MNLKSKIILLNGCSSAGKTSIARALGHLSDELWLTFGVDTFIEMLPPKKHNPYYDLISGHNPQGPTLSVELGPQGSKVFGCMPPFAHLLASSGNNLIIDEVLFDEASFLAYKNALLQHAFYYVGVLCELSVLQEREMLRGDRQRGLANDQMGRLYHGPYDMTVNTTKLSSLEAAKKILEFIQLNPK